MAKTESAQDDIKPQLDVVLATVISLPSGKIAKKIELKGRDFFQFTALSTKDPSDALRWLVIHAYQVDGKPLTVEDVDDNLSFEDVFVLVNECTKVLTESPTLGK